MIGNYYKRKHNYYGEYPPSYLKRIYSLFPDKQNILHIFSGMVDEKDKRGGVSIDINKNVWPDIVGNVEDLSFLKKDLFNLIIADPPYTKIDSEKYGTKHPNKSKVLKSCSNIVQSGGFLVWLDLMIPIYRKIDWNFVGTIAVLTGSNRKVRIVSIFQKLENV